MQSSKLLTFFPYFCGFLFKERINKMKLLKFRKTNSNVKIVLVLLLLLSSVGVSFGQEKEKETATPPTNGKAATNATVAPANNRTATQAGRLPATTTTDTREVVLSPAEEAAIQAEEERRLRLEAELAQDEAKAEIRRRTFGSSLFANTKFDIVQAINIATPNNYVLGAGDKLNVIVYGRSQRPQELTVNSDGFIILEKSGIVNVGGLNMTEAEAKIKNALSKTYTGINAGDTFVKISLTGFKTIKIKITGEVVAPGSYTVTSFTDLISAMYACGGPNEIGTYRDIKLVRGNRVHATLDIYDYIINGYSRENVLLKDQDIIHVGPYESRVAVNGQTKRIGLFEIKPKDKVQDLLKYAGGFNQYAYSEIIKIYRNTESERKIVNVSKPNFSSESVFTGDSLIVEKVLERIGNLVSIEGAIFRPGEYSLDSNPTLSKLIESALGLKEESFGGRIQILRTNEDLSISNIGVNYFDIKSGILEDRELKRFDRIIVPSMFEMTEKAVIKIKGAINNPEAEEGVELPFVKDMTIQDVIVRVGGLTEAAALSKIEIIRRKRNIDPKASDAQIADVITFNMRPDLSLAEGYESTFLLPYDEIIVRNSPNYEKQNHVKISGEVLYPGEFGIEYKDERISRLISRAGGLTDLAFLKGAKLYRKTLLSERQRIKREETMANLNIQRNVKQAEGIDPDALPTTATTITAEGTEADSYLNDEIGLDFEKILNNPGNDKYDMILQDGDEIVIPKRLETVRIAGEILYPNSVKFVAGKPFLSYVSEAGGFTKKSAKGSAIVVYPNGSVDRTRKFMFVRFHPKVEPGSEIMVPAKGETAADQFNKFSGLITTLSATLGTIVTIFGLIKLNSN
jgi:protein involved in polysaccharide export with SLBB domain